MWNTWIRLNVASFTTLSLSLSLSLLQPFFNVVHLFVQFSFCLFTYLPTYVLSFHLFRDAIRKREDERETERALKHCKPILLIPPSPAPPPLSHPISGQICREEARSVYRARSGNVLKLPPPTTTTTRRTTTIKISQTDEREAADDDNSSQSQSCLTFERRDTAGNFEGIKVHHDSLELCVQSLILFTLNTQPKWFFILTNTHGPSSQ